MEKGKEPMKLCFRWLRKWNMDFWQKLSDIICGKKGEKMSMFVHTICFGQKIFGFQNSPARKNY